MKSNTTYLEKKLAQTLTQMEESNIKHKAQQVVLKTQLEQQKQELKQVEATLETDKIREMRQQLDDAIALKQLEIEQLQ